MAMCYSKLNNAWTDMLEPRTILNLLFRAQCHFPPPWSDIAEHEIMEVDDSELLGV